MKCKIEFTRVPIHDYYGEVVNKVYAIVENGRCKVWEELNSLEKDKKAEIKSIISRMATINDFKSPKIRRTLKKYSYGEIKPHGHRIFYFKKCGNNIILFAYSPKKKDSLGDSFYKKLEKEKNIYEKKFKEIYG